MLDCRNLLLTVHRNRWRNVVLIHVAGRRFRPARNSVLLAGRACFELTQIETERRKKDSMQCTNCRAEIIAGELFCGECGTPVAAAPQAPQQFNAAPQVAPTVGAWQIAPTQLAPMAAM